MLLDDFEATIVNTVFDISEQYGIDVEVPIESEDYFRLLIRSYSNSTVQSFKEWLHLNISRDFISLAGRPKWIQGAEWPFQDGRPMIFAGQVDIAAANAKGFFHDDASIYIFLPYAETGEIVTIIQTF